LAGSAALEEFVMNKRQEENDRLIQIPQESEVWQLGVEQYLVRWINFAGRGWYPWMTVIYSLTHRAVVTDLPFWIEPPTEEVVWWVFWRAVVCPARPHRPTELQLRDDAIDQALKPWLEGIGITCVFKDKMEAVEKALFEVGEEFFGPR
jgi:hypothetical protein